MEICGYVVLATMDDGSSILFVHLVAAKKARRIFTFISLGNAITKASAQCVGQLGEASEANSANVC